MYFTISSTSNYCQKIASDDLPVQLYPFPVNPSRQVHVALPEVLLQTARTLQPPLFIAHLSESETSDVTVMKTGSSADADKPALGI